MTKISDKSADDQSEARISVAHKKNCHLSLISSFVKHPLGVNALLVLNKLYLYNLEIYALAVKWFKNLNENKKVEGLGPNAAPVSFSKTLIYLCHSPSWGVFHKDPRSNLTLSWT